MDISYSIVLDGLIYTNYYLFQYDIPEEDYLSWCHSCASSIPKPTPLSNADDTA